jgi:hypothetical protein
MIGHCTTELSGRSQQRQQRSSVVIMISLKELTEAFKDTVSYLFLTAEHGLG